MLELRTLGGILLSRDDVPVTGPAIQRRPLALLAQLAVAGEMGVSREKLVGRLWPESTEEAARRVLAQTLYAVKRAVGEVHIVDGTSVLRLNRLVIGSDVIRFTDAVTNGEPERVVEQYGGVFLDGFHLSDAAEFGHWVDSERHRIGLDYAQALERLAERAVERADHVAAVSFWRRRAALDPLNERIGVRVVQSLAASGDIAGAMQHARIHDALVRDELGDSASSPLLELADDLRSRLPMRVATVRSATLEVPPSVDAPAPTLAQTIDDTAPGRPEASNATKPTTPTTGASLRVWRPRRWE